MDVISLVVMLFVLFFLSNLGSFIFKRIHLPGMMGEIVFGIIAANLVLVSLGGWNLLDQIGIEVQTPNTDGSEGYNVLMLFSELGIIFLLFTVGLETKVSDLLKVGKTATLVAVLGIIIPFILGLLLAFYLGSTMITALFIATVLITTSAGVAAHVLKHLNVSTTAEGKIITSAAIISEILALIVLAVISGLAVGDTSTAGIAFTITKALVFVALALISAIFVMPKIHDFINHNRRSDSPNWNILFIGIGLCFGLAILAEAIGLSVIIGAYFAGMMFADYAEEWNLLEEVDPLKQFFMTFFFISVGIRVILSDLMSIEVLAFALAISAIAIFAKYFACSLGAKLGDGSLHRESLNLIGWGMVPKAEVVMVIATIGVLSGALDPVVFSCVVIMAIAATAVSHLMLEIGFHKKYGREGFGSKENV